MDELQDVGLGTMGIDDPATIETAIDLGYRHLDTAKIYGNEDAVGEGIARGGVDREDLFVATKLWIDQLAYDDAIHATKAALDRLGLETVDLLYVHRPRGQYDPADTLAAFDDLQDRGWIRHVGVSNFEGPQLEAAREHLDAPLFANQVEYHPLFQPTGALADAREHDYYLVAYSPLANGRAGEIPEVVEIAEKHGVTPETVPLAWLAAKENVTAIPKASSEAHLRANLEAAGVELDPADHDRLDGIDREDELFPE
ncbi:MAG: aldo/keto reductase [Halobacteriales archaeon]